MKLENRITPPESNFPNEINQNIPPFQSLLDQLSNIPPDEQTYAVLLVRKILEMVANDEFSKVPLQFLSDTRDEGLEMVIDEVIEDLRSNWRVEHPTKQEEVLSVFRKHPPKTIITNEELSVIFGNTSNPEKTASSKLSYIEKRLKDRGYRFEHVSGHRIVPVDNNS